MNADMQAKANEHATKAQELLDDVGKKKFRAGPDMQIMATRANTHATLAVFYAMGAGR